MKKIIFVLVCLLFVPIGVNAIGAEIECDKNTSVDSDGKAIKNCVVYIYSTSGTEKFYGIKLDWLPTNATYKSATTLDSRIEFKSNTNAGFEVKVEPVYGDVEDTGMYITGFKKLDIVKAVFYVTDSSKECTVNIKPTAWSCLDNNGTYYNLAGEVVSKEEYEADCGLLSCKEYNGKYYNSKGMSVTQNEYKLDCGKFSCETYNGKYYNSKGVAVSENEYKADCGKFSCETYNDKYYGNDGKEITKEAYEKECLPQKETPKCKIVDNKYYGSEGKEVAKEVYEKECPGEEVKTGIVSYTMIIIGIMVIAGTLYYHTKKRNYFN